MSSAGRTISDGLFGSSFQIIDRRAFNGAAEAQYGCGQTRKWPKHHFSHGIVSFSTVNVESMTGGVFLGTSCTNNFRFKIPSLDCKCAKATGKIVHGCEKSPQFRGGRREKSVPPNYFPADVFFTRERARSRPLRISSVRGSVGHFAKKSSLVSIMLRH